MALALVAFRSDLLYIGSVLPISSSFTALTNAACAACGGNSGGSGGVGGGGGGVAVFRFFGRSARDNWRE